MQVNMVKQKSTIEQLSLRKERKSRHHRSMSKHLEGLKLSNLVEDLVPNGQLTPRREPIEAKVIQLNLDRTSHLAEIKEDESKCITIHQSPSKVRDASDGKLVRQKEG